MTSSVLICVTCLFGVVLGNWEDWWSYNGISGPAYWALINPAWAMCNKGRKQSPINIDPEQLTYDSKLTNVMVDKHRVNGHITNTGQSLVFRMEQGQIPVNMTGGPLAYKYQFQEMFFHFGVSDKAGGSEHTVNGVSFPAEIQLLGFNAHLYTNLSQAKEYPGGVAAVSVMASLTGERPGRGGGEGLGLVASALQHVTHRGQTTPVNNLNLADILPSTTGYVTYEGSTTTPGCWETTTWIIINTPIYISKQELDMFYQLRQGDRVHEKGPLGNNVRPIQPLNSRSCRTNIAAPASKQVMAGRSSCSSTKESIDDWQVVDADDESNVTCRSSYHNGDIIQTEQLDGCMQKVSKCVVVDGQEDYTFESWIEHVIEQGQCCFYEGKRLPVGNKISLAAKCSWISCAAVQINQRLVPNLHVEVAAPSCSCCIGEDGEMYKEGTISGDEYTCHEGTWKDERYGVDHVLEGNNTLKFSCKIPLFQKRDQFVASWVDNEGNEYLPGDNHDGKHIVLRRGDLQILNMNLEENLKTYKCQINFRSYTSNRSVLSFPSSRIVIKEKSNGQYSLCETQPKRFSTFGNIFEEIFLRASPDNLTLYLEAWVDGESDISHFVVQYQLKDGGSWTLISDNAKPNSQLVISGLDPDTLYTVLVTAHNSTGCSTKQYEVVTPPLVMAREPCANYLQGRQVLELTEVSSNRVTVGLDAWLGEGGSEFRFILEYKAEGEMNWIIVLSSAQPGGRYLVPGLQPETGYHVRLTAHNSTACSVKEDQFTTSKK